MNALMEGATIYAAQCAHCHGDDGTGRGSIQALTHNVCEVCGDADAVAQVIAQTMPLDGPKCTGDCANYVSQYIAATFLPVANAACQVQQAPIRRLTRFEYSNSVHDLLGDTTRPGNMLPSEEIGNGFGNDANALSVSSLLAEQYSKVASAIAERAVNNTDQWQALHSCVSALPANQTSCAEQLIDRLLTRAFRRPATAAETTEFREFHNSISAETDFKTGVAAVIEAVLQSPEFLYRVEMGTDDPETGRVRPTGYEMATRLSYFLWGSMPDERLLMAAETGTLATAEGVLAEAERMLADPKAKEMVRFFFDNYLPISGLSGLERDRTLFPNFNSEIGALMREETQQFLQYLIFDGPGDWPTALTAPYTFMNEKLADFYGVGGVQGEQFQQVPLDPSQRLGLLTQAGIMAGTTHSTTTNPVARGAYVMKKMLCVNIPFPTGAIAEDIKPPNPDSGATARERFLRHSSEPQCAGCHALMDPVGLVFEHYDPVGLFRTHENNELIDTSGGLPGTNIQVTTAVELVQAIANDERTHQCFAYNWANFAYGKTIGGGETCLKDNIEEMFIESGYDIQTLILNLTQTDSFLYLPQNHRQQ